MAAFPIMWQRHTIIFFLETTPEIYEVIRKPELGDDFPFDKIHGGKNYGWREHKSKIRFYEYDGHGIWGITARIMEEFSHQINALFGTKECSLSESV